MATGTITSLGIGSSLDLQGILDSLRKADETTITRKQNEKTNLEATKNEFNTINAKLLSMKSSALSLSLSSNFLDRSISVSSSTVLSASIADGTNPGAYSATVNRLTTSSSFVSTGKTATTSSVYVPTIQKSANGFADPNADIVLAEDEVMTMTHGYGATRKIISITGEAGGSNLTQIAALIAADTENDTGGGSTYLTATAVQDTETSLWHLQISPTAAGTGEDNRVMVTYSPASTTFSAEAETFSYTMGDSDEISLSVLADTSLADLVTQINDDTNNPGVTASIINTGSGDSPYQLLLTADDAGEASRIVVTSQLTDLAITEVNGSGYTMVSDNALSFTSPVIIRPDAPQNNTDIVFQEDDGNGYTSNITATIATGVYQNGTDLATAVETALENASITNGNSKDYVVTFNTGTSKLEIQEAGTLTNLKILWSDAGSTAATALGFDATDETITPAGSSLNASITVDGVDYQRTKNTGITDVISGATLSLIGAGTTTINVTQDSSAIKEHITTLITTFNDVIAEIDANDDYDEDTDTWGSLAKTPSIRSAKDILLSLLGTKISANENITTYYDLGFEINKDGSVGLDETILDNKITSNFDDIKTFFIGTTAGSGVTGMGDLLNDQIKEQTKTNGLIDSETDALDDRLNRLVEQITTETERLDKRYETMAQQFVQLDSYMRQMESQQNYVSQIFSATEKKE